MADTDVFNHLCMFQIKQLFKAVKFIALERLLQVAKAHLAIYKVSLAIKIDLFSNQPAFTN